MRLVIARADAMHDAGTEQPGTMAAVLGLDDEQVDVACRRADADVWVANYNAPGQVVIAGSPDGVAAAADHAKALGAKKVMPLQVSGAFHTPFMIGARDRLRAAIAAASPRDTEVPVVSNVDALPHQLGGEWASLLSAQLSSPVRWKHVLLELADHGVDEFVELGPGGVLTGMAKRTVTDRRGRSPWPRRRTSTRSSSSSSRRCRRGRPRIEGEHLFASERLVVSPAAGIFTRAADIGDGAAIEVGTVLGHVGEHEVRSPFAGVLQSYIAVDTERVMPRQPIAWLRTTMIARLDRGGIR